MSSEGANMLALDMDAALASLDTNARRLACSAAGDSLCRKLVAHRGWHRMSDEDTSRPLENTRQAYLLTSRLGAAYAECDVWKTRDDRLVLSHDFCLRSMAADQDARAATVAIRDLDWAEVRDLRLKDGSTPVLLETVLEDLVGTATKLAVELKTVEGAGHTCRLLASRPELAERVGFFLSFSLNTLESIALYWSALCPEEARPRLVWIVSNPHVPYAHRCEGELDFDYTRESLLDFLDRLGLVDRVCSLGCGLYVQYNPKADLPHIRRVREDLICLHANSCGAAFLGLWSDVSLDPDFDCHTVISKYLPAVDAINSDIAPSFWVA